MLKQLRNIMILAVLVIYSQALAQWTEPTRIPGSFEPIDPEAVAVGDTIHVLRNASSGGFTYLRSTDNGMTWSDPVHPVTDTTYDCWDAHIFYNRGKLHLTFVAHQFVGLDVYHISSTDGGRTWSSPQRVFSNNSLMLKYPKMAANGNSLILCCRTDTIFKCFRSFDGGHSWNAGGNIEQGPIMIDQDPFIYYASGRVHVIYCLGVVGDTVSYEIYYRNSTSFGVTWGPRIPLSTLEGLPHCRASQGPSAYVDSAGHISAFWMDYKYGGMCDISGEILGRYSSDNGNSWGDEIRLTDTQSGINSSTIIKNGIIHVIWDDRYEEGCGYPKILYSYSTDGGLNWSEHFRITDYNQNCESWPCLFIWPRDGNSLLHAIFYYSKLNEGEWLYYSQYDLSSAIKGDDQAHLPNKVEISAYPNPFNSSVLIKFNNLEKKGGELSIYDITGQKVKTFTTEGKEEQINWDARDAEGNKVCSGIYFARALNRQYSSVIKLIYLK